MQQIKLKDFLVFPIISSVSHEDISDEEYFGKRYRAFISNSSMSGICPAQGGSMEKYYGPREHLDTSALALGSVVHCKILQPNDFELMPKCNKPTAKLGKVIDAIKKYRNRGESIYDSITLACREVDYYKTSIDRHISDIIKKGFEYYWTSKNYNDNQLTLNNKDWETATKCIENVTNDSIIIDTLHPKTIFGNEVPSYNEDTLFLDYCVMYNGNATILHIKGKLDNWTIDDENKILTLNDLKTTGKPVAWFTNREYGSLYKYHYLRQLALYKEMLEMLCMKEYGYSKDWSFKTNILAVETVGDCNTKLISISEKQIQQGRNELLNCLKRIGYYEIFGHEEEVEFV